MLPWRRPGRRRCGARTAGWRSARLAAAAGLPDHQNPPHVVSPFPQFTNNPSRSPFASLSASHHWLGTRRSGGCGGAHGGPRSLCQCEVEAAASQRPGRPVSRGGLGRAGYCKHGPLAAHVACKLWHPVLASMQAGAGAGGSRPAASTCRPAAARPPSRCGPEVDCVVYEQGRSRLQRPPWGGGGTTGGGACVSATTARVWPSRSFATLLQGASATACMAWRPCRRSSPGRSGRQHGEAWCLRQPPAPAPRPLWLPRQRQLCPRSSAASSPHWWPPCATSS